MYWSRTYSIRILENISIQIRTSCFHDHFYLKCIGRRYWMTSNILSKHVIHTVREEIAFRMWHLQGCPSLRYDHLKIQWEKIRKLRFERFQSNLIHFSPQGMDSKNSNFVYSVYAYNKTALLSPNKIRVTTSRLNESCIILLLFVFGHIYQFF